MEIIKFNSSLTVQKFEDAIVEQIGTTDLSKSILLDFQNVIFIEITSLIYILSFLTKLIDENVDVKMRLPKNLSVRNIFRIWRFPIVFNQITNIHFSSIVVEEDLKYFGESKNLQGDYYNKLGYSEYGLKKLLENGFFALSSLPFDNEYAKSKTLREEPKHWEDIFIKSVLDKHLKKFDQKQSSDVIPRIIIYECLTNAYRHPNATSLVRGSFFDRQGKHFTIFYWDNGTSLIETLKTPLLEQQNIRAAFDWDDNAKKIFSNFKIKLVTNNESFYDLLYSDIVPTKESTDHELLLACFYPGVSRDPEGKNDFMGNTNFEYNSPGMGLTYLLMAAVDKLQGQVAVRTQNYFLNIKKLSNKEHEEIKKQKKRKFDKSYRAKIVDYSEKLGPFNGNMITIRLPLS